MRNVSEKVVVKIKTHFILKNVLENRAVYDTCAKIWQSRAGHRWR